MRFSVTLLLLLAACVASPPEPGPPLQLLVQGQRRPIARAQVHSVANDNSRFAIVIWSPGPAEMEQLLESVLVGGEIELSCSGGSGGADQAQHWFTADRDLALAVAERLGVPPLERVEPELVMGLTVRPHVEVFVPGAGVPASVRISNAAPQAVAFSFGGRWASSGRDNRFDFQATHDGLSLPEPARDYDFGGLGSRVRLEPGEHWETEVNLADWFPVTGPGVYQGQARFELDLEDAEGGGWAAGEVGFSPLWSSELRGVFQFELH